MKRALLTATLSISVVGACADLPAISDVPDVVVGERGSGDGGRLLSMQLFVDAGDYATRDRIRAAHLSFQQGLMWTLANHPRVPEKIRAEASRWGLSRDEFTDNDGWPTQLYVREARRMTGAYVMTEHNCTGRDIAPDAVGLGAYSMDSHNTQRYVNAAGHVVNEGDVQVRVRSPYPIAYGSIIPRAAECENLLVPVALSATHIAYGSIRMEPVFMVLGHSAAIAAAHAIAEKTSVQAIDRARLREKLLADKQVLVWTPPPSPAPATKK
jgi:hypothetical protein